jgi:hypothetical protein
MTIGDSFWGDPTGGNNDHLWVILNDPGTKEGVCALLNFSTDRTNTAKYFVPAGYHDGITARSTICYGDMIAMADDFIEAEILFGGFRSNPPFPPAKVSFLLAQAKTLGIIDREIKALL